MQNSALAGALVRFLNDERLDCCVLGVAAADRVNLVVPAGALAPDAGSPAVIRRTQQVGADGSPARAGSH